MADIIDFSFDTRELRDMSECPKNCLEQYRAVHKHCAIDGCVLFAEGGGGADGRSIAGYEGVECEGDDCEALIAEKCVTRWPGGKVLCARCFTKRRSELDSELPLVFVQRAVESLRLAREWLSQENRGEYLSRILSELAVLSIEATTLKQETKARSADLAERFANVRRMAI